MTDEHNVATAYDVVHALNSLKSEIGVELRNGATGYMPISDETMKRKVISVTINVEATYDD